MMMIHDDDTYNVRARMARIVVSSVACRLRLADSTVCLFLPPFPPYLRARQSQLGLTALGGPTGLALNWSYFAGFLRALAWRADVPHLAKGLSVGEI